MCKQVTISLLEVVLCLLQPLHPVLDLQDDMRPLKKIALALLDTQNMVLDMKIKSRIKPTSVYALQYL